MGFLTLEGLERLWNHIVALVGNKIDSLGLKGSTGAYSVQQTNANDASGFSSIALGGHTTAKGNYSIAMGSSTIAEGEDSIAAGYYSKAIGDNSFAEGYRANANGSYSQAKGYYVNANGTHSTVIGKYNDTPDKSGYYESIDTLYQTFENNSTYTKVIGTPILDAENGRWIFEGTEEVLGSALAVGDYVCNTTHQWRELTSLKSSTSTGRTFNDKRHNIESYNTKQSTYAFVVGNGTSNNARSNAHTLDWNGNAWFAGDVYVNGSGTTNAFTGAKKVATESYVDTKVAGLVDSAPSTLDTLNELAAALGDDPNFATTVATEIGKKADKTDLVALTEAEILEVCVIN